MCGGQAAAVKVYNLRRYGAAAAFENEKLAYHELEALQGGTIPLLLRSGVLQHMAAPVIATLLEGAALPHDERVPARLHEPLREALQALYAAGAAHGDVRRSNFVVCPGAVRLIDLGQTVLRASPALMAGDRANLRDMMQP